MNGPWCHVTTGSTITNVTMTTGDYFFDLGQDFKLNSAAVSWNAGLLPTVTQTGTTTSGNAAVTLSAATSGVYVGQAVTGTGIANGTTVSSLSGTALTLSAPATASGSTSLSFSGGCAPTYSSTASPADATPPAHGVTLAFGGASGLAWYAGNFTACPKPVDVGLHPTDRPVVVYGPTTALTGSITVPAYYRDTMTGSGTAFTSPVSDSISARGTCAMSDAVDTCDIVDVPVVGGRAYDTNSCGNVACGTDGTQMRLYGAVFAQSSRVSLSLNPVNSDSMTLYGVVAKNLRVITNGLQVSADPSLFGISSGLSSILDPKNILVRFTAYSCTNNTLYPIPPATGGTSVCGPTGGGQTTSPDANWQGSQFTISGVSADGTTATMTTSAAHGLATGEQVVISGFTGASSAYNTTSTPATVTVTSATTFTIPSTTIAALAGSPKVTYGPPQAFSFFGLSFSAGSSYTSACPPTTVYPWVGCLVESFNTTTETSYLTPVGAGPIASNSPPWLIVG